MTTSSHWLYPAFEAIAIDDDGRTCADIPESACRDEAGNFFAHVTALSLSKSSDALIDPKLVLSWLIPAVGAPPALVGMLVPIREAGALLPQIFTAEQLRRLPQRKWAWSAGAIVQGLAALAIAASAAYLSGLVAGVAILVALAVLSLARSVCSVCYKDVLGKTVDKSRRGRATGLASTLAASVAIGFAAILFLGLAERFDVVVAAVAIAGLVWIGAGLVFTTLSERAGATDGGASAFRSAIDNLAYFKTQPQLRVFIVTRALLTATAFAPPFMVALVADGQSSPKNLGLLVFSSALAALLSSFIWGSLADRSSRRVLLLASVIGATALAATLACSIAGVIRNDFVLPALLFVLMVSYQGVRLGRSTHLVDMANTETRAAFTALSNTAIGLVLLAGGAFSLIANVAGLEVTLAILAVMCGLAGLAASRLDEVQA
jgi:hypothetical protein